MTERQQEFDLEISDAARELTHRSVVIDTVTRPVLDDRLVRDAATSRVTVLGRTILTSSGDVFSPFGFKESMREIGAILEFVDAHPDEFMLVKSGADIDEAHRSNRTGIYVYFQSPEPLQNQPWRLRLFYELGLRVLQLTYNQRSLLGDGCSEATDGGLSAYGKHIVSECNRLGIAVDVSHSSYNTASDAMDVSTDPVLFTHANSASIVPHLRNKTDEQVKRCAELGGVVGVMSLPAFLRKDESHKPTLFDMIDHIDHYVELIGVEHVGLGLDLTTGHEYDDFSLLGYRKDMYSGVWVDGVQQYLPGMESVADILGITEELLRRGYSDSDISLILGGNFSRVLRQIWDKNPGA